MTHFNTQNHVTLHVIPGKAGSYNQPLRGTNNFCSADNSCAAGFTLCLSSKLHQAFSLDRVESSLHENQTRCSLSLEITCIKPIIVPEH